VLLVSRGLVATPGPDKKWSVALAGVLDNRPPRAEALLFLEQRSDAPSPHGDQNPALRTSGLNYRGRY
jgi:hypothetical protein